MTALKPLALTAVCVVALTVAGYLLVARNGSDLSQSPIIQERYVAAEGKIEALDGYEMAIGSDLIARIETIEVEEGVDVRQGQLIATLDSRDIKAQLRQAETEVRVAQAKLAEVASGARQQEIDQARAALERAIAERELTLIELKRCEGLHDKAVISTSRLDEVENAYRVAVARVKEAEEAKQLLEIGPKPETVTWREAQVAKAKADAAYYQAMLDKTRILAPVSGKLIERYLEPGEIIIPETPLAVIADVTKVWVNAEVDETDIGKLHVGAPATVRSNAYPGQVFQGRVEEIADYVGRREIKPNSPAVNLGLKVAQVKIGLLEAHPFRLGMTVDVKMLLKDVDSSPSQARPAGSPTPSRPPSRQGDT